MPNVHRERLFDDNNNELYDTCCTCRSWQPTTVWFRGVKISVCRQCRSMRAEPGVRLDGKHD